MPEGQISHRNAARLTATLGDRPLRSVDVAHPRLDVQRIPTRLAGDRLVRADAIGKHHLLRFASGRILHSHLGMAGRWRILDAAGPIPRAGLWLALVTDRYVAAQYHGPRLRLHEAGEPIRALTRLGSDLLAEDVDPAAASAAAIARADPDCPVVEAVVDQRLLAGIGNVYRSETLFLCGIHPLRPAGRVTSDEARAIGTTAASLLAAGAATGGPIRTYRSPDPRSRDRTWVYGRAARPCRRCGTAIAVGRTGQAHRTVFWCPACQPSAVDERA